MLKIYCHNTIYISTAGFQVMFGMLAFYKTSLATIKQENIH
ncbi:putative membrane protein [Acinetobacter sp. 263903-1]|nr:putative membrane protein [Acinetobacter sp. 1294596]KCX39372.1 putative membrane protein [Acinetobacter sp. 263903-1]